MENQIRWKRGDAIKLGKAVASFNRKINELEKETDMLFLPEKLDFKQIKENITTRKELNRQVESIKRFKREGAEEIVTTKAGEPITKWEYQELRKQANIARRNFEKRLSELGAPVKRQQILTNSNGLRRSKRT